jgi:hypothetical protein
MPKLAAICLVTLPRANSCADCAGEVAPASRVLPGQNPGPIASKPSGRLEGTSSANYGMGDRRVRWFVRIARRASP